MKICVYGQTGHRLWDEKERITFGVKVSISALELGFGNKLMTTFAVRHLLVKAVTDRRELI